MAERCNVYVYVRDCYRRTGRGKTGFEMHYERKQCSRQRVSGDMCKQHAKMRDEGMNFVRVDRERSRSVTSNHETNPEKGLNG